MILISKLPKIISGGKEKLEPTTQLIPISYYSPKSHKVLPFPYQSNFPSAMFVSSTKYILSILEETFMYTNKGQ